MFCLYVDTKNSQVAWIVSEIWPFVCSNLLRLRSRDLDDTLFGFTWIDLNDLNSRKPESHEFYL